MSLSLSGIWAGSTSVAMTFDLIGSTVQVTIAADCVDSATQNSACIYLDTVMPVEYRPSTYRTASVTVIKADTPAAAVVSVKPSGGMTFSIIGTNWEPDTPPALSGVSAQVFTYQK